MPPAGVVEALYVLKDRRPHHLPGRRPVAPVEKLRLEGGDKRLSEGIVVGRTRPTHRRHQSLILQSLAEGLSEVYCTPLSEWCTSPGDALRLAIAICKASTTSSVLR